MDMYLHMEQQQKDMATIAEKTVQNMVNQIPLIVHNALLGLGSVLNVIPLQLKGLTSLQPLLILTEGNPTLQGSGTSTCGESSRKRKESPSHLST